MLCTTKISKITRNEEILDYGWFELKEARQAVKDKALKIIIGKYIKSKKEGTS